MRLDNVRLLVDDFDECFRFYRDTMALKVTWGREGGGYASFDAGEGSRLSIFPRREMAEAIGPSGLATDGRGQDRSVLVFGVDDLDSTLARLRSRGVKLTAEPADHRDWGIRTAHIRDPDGNLIELNSPLPTDEWTEDLRRAAGKAHPEANGSQGSPSH